MRLCHAICCTNFLNNAIYCIDLQDKKIEVHRKYSTKGFKHLFGGSQRQLCSLFTELYSKKESLLPTVGDKYLIFRLENLFAER